MLGMRHPGWDRRVIRSLGGGELVSHPSEWSQNDDEIKGSASGRTALTRASGRSKLR